MRNGHGDSRMTDITRHCHRVRSLSPYSLPLAGESDNVSLRDIHVTRCQQHVSE